MARPVALVVALLVCSCGFSPASELAKPPEFDPAGQTLCRVKKSQDKPLVVEWPSADRAELEATAKSGTVVVSYSGCEMRVLSRCRAPGRYGYVPVTPKADTVTIKNDDELYASIPIYAAKFEAKLAQSGQLNVAMTMVGRYATDQSELTRAQLRGACDGATHVITGLTVGAFEFFAGAGAEIGGGAEVVDVGAGAKSVAKKETLTVDGRAADCAKATDADTAPPQGCGALIRVEVAPLGGTSQPARDCPRGTRWDGKTCAPETVVTAGNCPIGWEWDGSACKPNDEQRCGAGFRFEQGRGCVPDHAGAQAPKPASSSSAPTASPGAPPTEGGFRVEGKLSREVIERVVRQNDACYRRCYQDGLRRDPKLQGTVSVRFVIGRDGFVANVGGGGDLPDGLVTSCVIDCFRRLKFPAPESGIVLVTYPMTFRP